MSEIWQLQTPLPTYECASSPTSTVTDSPPRLKARPAKVGCRFWAIPLTLQKSPHLVCISPNGDLSDLAPPEVYPSGRDLFPIPWKHIDNFTCTAHIPSTAAHVSECDPGDANWVLVLDAFRGAGTYVDVFQGWLLARECGSDGETVTMAPRPVVAKICDILDLAPDDQELALRALEREGQLFNGPLAALQGSAVPLFYGLFEVTSDPCPPHLPLEMRMFVSIFEDCGLHATPEDEDWSFALMSEQDK